MKKLMYGLVVVLVLAAVSPVFATVVATENFESGTVGNTLDLDGWQGQWGLDPTVFITSDRWNSKSAEITASVGQVYKPFNSTNTITDADVDVYIKADLLVLSQPQWAGPHIGGAGGATGPALGENAGSWNVQSGSGANIIGDATAATWADHEVVLQMSINQSDITLSTGTLYHRPLAGGAWTEDSILKDFNLALTNSNKPSLWDSWWMRAQYNGGFDNLEIGTGVVVPEPATLLLLAIGGLTMLRKRRA